MKFGLDIPTAGVYADPGKLADLAVEAEDAGWDGFFIWDIVFAENQSDVPVVDPWVALAAIAARTRRIKIGAMLTPLPRRRPWQVAREAVAIDLLSNGRLVFGAGSGYQARDFTAFGEDADAKIRAEKLDEGLEVLNGLWSGKEFSFHGKHYEVNEVEFLPKPLQSPRIPIWLAGGWPRRKPFRRAARWDGIYVMTVNQETGELLTLDEIREIAAYLHSHRESPAPFDIGVNGESKGNDSHAIEQAQAFSEAGATWWIELEGSRETFETYRERIRLGPPRK
jgi:alkanesulfonate monooxygenase SsuD/methylene tetrahydromethanopterin reductase-like flavin-dependent oxidoreductase (luciferase family)